MPPLCGERGLGAEWDSERVTSGGAGASSCSHHLVGSRADGSVGTRSLSRSSHRCRQTRATAPRPQSHFSRRNSGCHEQSARVARGATLRHASRRIALRRRRDIRRGIPVLRSLNQSGLRSNTTLLGEGVKDPATTRAVVDEYKADLDRIAAEGLQTNIALKLTHLGLDLDPELAYRNVADVVAHAATHGNFIRIDMEESARVDDTLRIYRRLRGDGHDNVGTVLQSYLYRTPADLESLLPLAPNLRLVKGAYLEPASIAYPRKADVDRA